jgi:hypothetical protein
MFQSGTELSGDTPISTSDFSLKLTRTKQTRISCTPLSLGPQEIGSAYLRKKRQTLTHRTSSTGKATHKGRLT